MSSEKPTNPKDLIGTDKVPLDLVPGTAKAYQALGHLEGNLKYGLVNWREAGVRTSIYLAALERHLEKFKNGEWADPVTRVPHLGSMGACINIIIDAFECGKLIDDRPLPAPVSECIDRLSENVKHLRELFADKNPIHYTISGPMRMKEEPVERPVCPRCGKPSARKDSYCDLCFYEVTRDIQTAAACQRVVMRSADDTAAYLSAPCTCGKCPGVVTPHPGSDSVSASTPAPGPGPSAAPSEPVSRKASRQNVFRSEAAGLGDHRAERS